MKTFFGVLTLLLLNSAFATEFTTNRNLKGHNGGKKGGGSGGGKKGGSGKPKRKKKDIFISAINAAQEVTDDGDFYSTSNALGNAYVTYDEYKHKLCIFLSYTGLEVLPELFSHIHGPAHIGENGPVIFTLSTGRNKNDCFTLTSKQEKYLYDGLLYFNIHSEAFPAGELRGQIQAL